MADRQMNRLQPFPEEPRLSLGGWPSHAEGESLPSIGMVYAGKMHLRGMALAQGALQSLKALEFDGNFRTHGERPFCLKSGASDHHNGCASPQGIPYGFRFAGTDLGQLTGSRQRPHQYKAACGYRSEHTPCGQPVQYDQRGYKRHSRIGIMSGRLKNWRCVLIASDGLSFRCHNSNWLTIYQNICACFARGDSVENPYYLMYIHTWYFLS